jgi:LuxR family maltose regulon positive regulatory protein
MQQQIRYRVSWNEHKGSYEIQHFRSRPRVIGWLGMKPDSANWFALLTQIPSFHFQARDGGHFTARKETRARGGVYWIAYRHIHGKLKKKYIGPQAHVTIARLEEIVGELEVESPPKADA